MSFKEWAWACDPIGSFLLVAAATLMLLALNWAGGAYPWNNPHVCASLTIGIVLFVAFCFYGELFRECFPVEPLLTVPRMERKIRWHRRPCLLFDRTELLALDICLYNRGLDLLFSNQRRHATAYTQHRFRR